MNCSTVALLALLTSLTPLYAAPVGAQAQDITRYPDLKGHWERFRVPGLRGQPSFDQTKSWGLGQQAPLTPEYRAIFEASLADQAKGGQGDNTPRAKCLASGMPLMMIAFEPLEFVVTPDTTYVLVGSQDHPRRIFTDGREWPKEIVPTYQGYSIGKWIDEDGDGWYDTLEVETRGFKGPRFYDNTGLPLHHDNLSVFKERIHLDKADPNTLHDEITVIDHALTRPWIVDKKYIRNTDSRLQWDEFVCSEDNPLVFVGKEMYYLSGDGFLMPTRKDQPPPDSRYFKQSQE
jgi:hypothetical protein